MKELQDKRNKLLRDAQALLIKADVTAADTESAQRMLDEADAIEKRLATLAAINTKIAADEALPRFLANTEPVKPSWLSNHLNLLAIVVVVLGVLVAIVVFR